MDKSLTVVQGTVITSAGSAFLTAIYSTFKGNRRPGLLASSAALNGGLCAASFFTIREYLISPTLVSILPTICRKRELELSVTDHFTTRPDETSWSALRCHKLLDTSLSGATAGGLLNGWRSGRRAIIPGIATAALLCGMLQLVFNEVGVARIRLISRTRPGYQPPLSLSNPSMIHAPHEPVPFAERLMTSLGLHKLSDEAYLKRLKQTRASYLVQIKKLEQLEREGEREDKDLSSHSSGSS